MEDLIDSFAYSLLERRLCHRTLRLVYDRQHLAISSWIEVDGKKGRPCSSTCQDVT